MIDMLNLFQMTTLLNASINLVYNCYHQAKVRFP